MKLVSGFHRVFLDARKAKTRCAKAVNDYSFEWNDRRKAIVLYDDCITIYDTRTADAQSVAWLK